MVCYPLSMGYQNMTNPISQTEQPVTKSACGGVLKDPTKYPSAMFNGERVYFCTKACLNVFLQAPEAFMAGEVEHPEGQVETPT